MQNINFKITKEDIREYMRNHKQIVCNKEALFVEYMKETKGMSVESLEMFNQKHCLGIPPINDKVTEMNPAVEAISKLNFQNYLQEQSLGIKGLYHILVPAIGFFQKEQKFQHMKTIMRAYDIIQELDISDVSFLDPQGRILKDVIENYTIAGQIEDFGSNYRGYSNIIMTRKKCRDELLEYENIYGTEVVRKVRKLVREREW